MQGKRIAFGLSGQIVAEFANKVVPLIILHIVVNRLGAESFGYAQFGITVIELAIPFVLLGYPNLATVHIGAKIDDPVEIGAIISETLVLRLINLFLVVPILFAVVASSPHYADYFPLVAALSFVLFTSAIEMYFVHVGTQRLVSLSAINVLVKISSLVAILFFIKGPEDSILFAILSFGSNGVIAVGTFFYNCRRFPLSLPSRARLWQRMTQSLPFSLMYFWTAAWLSADLVIAEFFYGKQGSGIYGANMRLAAAVLNLLNAVAMVFFSEVVASKSKTELSKLINVAILAVLSLALPISAGSWFTATPILELMLNEEFAAHPQVFSYMFSAVGGTILITILGFHLLLFLRKAKLQNFVMSAALAMLVLLAAAAQSHFGFEGIAMGSMAARWLAALALLVIARPYLDSYWFKEWGKVALSTAGMVLALYIAPTTNLWLTLALGVSVYLVLFLALFRSKISHYRKLIGS